MQLDTTRSDTSHVAKRDLCFVAGKFLTYVDDARDDVCVAAVHAVEETRV